jgi:hypothetical protein
MVMRQRYLLAAVVLAACADNGTDGADGSNGADGVSSLTRLVTEEAGDNCAEGGVRINNGPDANGNGELDTSEVAESQYVCNGTSGETTFPDGGVVAGNLVAVNPEPEGANCSAGGVVIATGSDADGDGVLDNDEVSNSQYVCNTDVGSAFGTQPIVRQFASAAVTVETGNNPAVSQFVQTASITVPGPGQVYVTASADVYCSTTSGAGTFDCPATGDIRVYLTVSQEGVGAETGNSGDATLIVLERNITENMSASNVFGVAAAGTYTFRAPGMALTQPTGTAGRVGFFRRAITLVYLPQ